jgi:hypothetical protein
MKLKKYIEEREILTSAKRLIAKARKGDFKEWVESKPDILDKIYKGNIPSAEAILKNAEKGIVKDTNAIDHWESAKQWKVWKKERWGK